MYLRPETSLAYVTSQVNLMYEKWLMWHGFPPSLEIRSESERIVLIEEEKISLESFLPSFLRISKEAQSTIQGVLTSVFFDVCELIFKEREIGVPIMKVEVELLKEPESEWEELVLKIQVDLKFDEAMRLWDDLAMKVDKLKNIMPYEKAKVLDEKVALHVEWSE